MKNDANVLVAHDYFAIRGGGEKLCLTLAQGLDAELLFGYRTDDSYNLDQFPGKLHDLRIPRQFQRSMLRVPALSLGFSASRGIAKPFRNRIYSGITSVFAAPAKNGGSINIHYCHTPPRFLFDQKKYFNSLQKNTAIQPIKNIALSSYKRNYMNAMEKMDVIVANSRNVQSRIKKYIGRESFVIYPPIDVDQFNWLEQGDYYLSTARLAPLKRVHHIVEAFRKMPNRNLVIASGGEEQWRLRELARDCPNIVFTGWTTDAEMQDLVGRCIATIYIPIDEDFGMSPVESMAAGKPVIGVAEGGLKETILDQETGFLLSPNFDAEQIREAVEELSPDRALRMRTACEIRAAMFSKTRFLAEMRSLLV